VHAYPLAVKKQTIYKVVSVWSNFHMTILVVINPGELSFFILILLLRNNDHIGKDVDCYWSINADSLALVDKISS